MRNAEHLHDAIRRFEAAKLQAVDNDLPKGQKMLGVLNCNKREYMLLLVTVKSIECL